MVPLSDGGRLVLRDDESIVRLDRHGEVVEVVRSGDIEYRYWRDLVERYGVVDRDSRGSGGQEALH